MKQSLAVIEHLYDVVVVGAAANVLLVVKDVIGCLILWDVL